MAEFHLGHKGGGSGRRLKFDVAQPSGKPRLTPNQRAQQQAAKKKGHSEDLWDRIKSGGGHTLHGVAWTFSQILRPSHGVAGMFDELYKHPTGSFLKNLELEGHGFVKGFVHNKPVGFGQVLEHAGALKGHRRLRGLAGFGLDVGLDPFTYLTGGTTLYASSAEHAAAIAAGRRALEDGYGKALSKGVHIDDAIAQNEHDIQALAKQGKNYRFRHKLAQEQARQLKATKDGVDLPYEQTQINMRILSRGAIAEEKRVEQYLPHLKMFGKQITPTRIGPKALTTKTKSIGEGTKLVPALPKLDDTIARNLPVVSRLAEGFRNALIRPKGLSPEAWATGMMGKHLGERLTHEQTRGVEQIMHDAGKGINKDRQLEALHYFEQPLKGFRAVVKKGGRYELNPRYVKHLTDSGILTDAEVRFVDAAQQAMEYLYYNEKAFGTITRHFSAAKGKMYFPHMADAAGGAQSDAMHKLSTLAGFERARSHREFSLKQIGEFVKAGELPKEVVTDPYQAIIKRVRASSRRQADLAHLHTLAEVAGVPTRIVDEAALTANRTRQNAVAKLIRKTTKEHDQHMANAQGVHDWLVAAHADKYTRDVNKLEAAIRKVRAGPKSKTKAARIANINKQLAARKARHVEETGKIEKGTFEPLNNEVRPHTTWAKNAHEDLLKLNKELKQLKAKEGSIGRKGSILHGKKNAAYRVSMFTDSGAVDKFGHKIAFEGDIGQAVQRVQRVVEGDDATIKAFEGVYRKFLSRWKLLVTSINPGYRMRNSATDLWNWWLKAGVNPVTASNNMARAYRFMHNMKNIEQKLAKAEAAGDEKRLEELRQTIREFHDMYDSGVLSGLYQGDIQTAAEMLRLANGKTSLLAHGRVIKFLEKSAQDMNRNGENFIRIAHWQWAMKDREMGRTLAADSVKSAHFDYEQLTPFEQRRLKSIMPFYTWTRKNIPYQIKAMFENPGKYSAFPKMVQESEYASGGDKGNIVPGYIPDAMGFQIPFFGKHNYLLPQLGVSDLQVFDSPKGPSDRALQLLSPFIKAPLEIATNKNLFTGGQIASDTHPRTPVSPLVAAVLQFVPGSNVGQTSRIGQGGKHQYGPGANPYLVYALNQLGPSMNLAEKSGGIKAKATPISPLWSYLGGLSIQHIDPAQQKLLAQISISNEAKKMIQASRDEGHMRQAKRKKNKKANRIAQELGRR